ncbi:type II and III secretion system protein family protein [Methylophaga thalassica]|uniref:type II and III secretion system protein family protein n=1 Tax=Methylophaga aminisulfidivorans TaxID=230105 RepID=UPI003A8F02F9
MLLLCLSGINTALAQITNLVKGQANAIQVDQQIGSVFIADPAIADYQIIEKNKLVVFGKDVGTTSLLVFGQEGETVLSRQLVVNQSMVHIQQQISLKYPELDISIYNLGTQVVLSGIVSSEEQKQDIERLVGELLGKEVNQTKFTWETEDQDYDVEFMDKYRYSGIVNNLEVAITKQVNVKLTVAEVSHSFLEQFGVTFGSDGQGTGVFVDSLTHFSASDIVSVITAVGSDSIGQILAEPNLSVISGESASFLVGGELPVVTVVDGGTSVSYREYGVRLEVAAKVLRDDKIKLALMPEVSSLDEQYSNTTYDLPALRSRKARTTVELGNGQSFILGGLLSTEETESLTKVPFIGDIPILGALFRHTETERTKTELVIVATVNLVKPVEASDVALPTMQRTTTLERFFALDDRNEDYAARQWLRKGGFVQ